ncbi:uncharacterized protein F4807DRAFT_448487 [Annulohypoxylon truncatum]|uniref:uncharacterized protein n=1 Tax=Annulohypoxylon truncatum TaxID=327061 RepID=UPI002007ACAE|nr:uncharacterized protein F4807DRAFT_448487 [Annulohypoxylon truncatum]KAI1204184.1 hypothetical protein F4807DRAFT_448487 [Annulohypoxylon truncatum]
MAEETPPGDNGSPGGKLFNTAISDFASNYVKTELHQLTRERDDALARSHVPKLRALLREVDKERQAFIQDKEKLIRDLRKKLELLEVDPDTIETTITELAAVTPKYLSIIPSASTLTVRPPTPFLSPVRDDYFSTVLGADTLSGAPPLPSQILDKGLDQGIANPVKRRVSSPTNIHVSPNAGPNVDHQIQDQILSESSAANQTPKRAATDGDGNTSAKRRRVDSGRTLSRTQSDIFRKIAFPNLETGERIFRHVNRSGLFVIRCNRSNCQTGFFTEPPLAYNRALKHFQNHGETGQDGEELTNEYIFENFACEIEGTSMVSKYWIKEHLGPSPHTFVPGKSRSRTTPADSNATHKRQDEDNNYTSSSKPHDPVVDDESDEEELQVEKPRRTPRSVARPDYAELVANKDPWNLSDADSEVCYTLKV